MNFAKRKTTTVIILILLIFLCLNQGEADTYSASIQSSEKTALILNPTEYIYGNRHCEKIVNTLERIGYTVIYKANEEIDLNYVRNMIVAIYLLI